MTASHRSLSPRRPWPARRSGTGHDACGIGFVADTAGRATRQVIEAGLAGLAGVRHRGAVAADRRTSDGCGLLSAIPATVAPPGTVVAMLFWRGEHPERAVAETAGTVGLAVASLRTPPTDPSVLGDIARREQPRFLQVLLVPGTDTDAGDPDAIERQAWRFRRALRRNAPDIYVASCSARSIVHKGLIPAEHLADFWVDLADPATVGSFAVFHQRFSTNTDPTWERAQPFRALCHNGEINTIAGNERRLLARSHLGTASAGLGEEEGLRPILDTADSDSGKLDEVVELLCRGGRDVCHAVAMVVPAAWEARRDLDADVRGFYEYHSSLMEPWDGPAGLVFTDGATIGAALDRNGLRPLRYLVCDDGLVVCCSEVGAVPLGNRTVVERGRLGPGEMLAIVPGQGLLANHEIKARLGSNARYASWAEDGFRSLGAGSPTGEAREDLARRQVAHGFTKEDLAMVLKPMSTDAREPSFAMGDDSPLPHLAGRPRPLFHFFRQRFAQVTNPPIDPLRERLVMSLRTLLGPRAPLLTEAPDAAHLLELDSFFCYPSGVASLDRPETNPFPVRHLDATFCPRSAAGALRDRLAELADDALDAAQSGDGILVIDHTTIGPGRVALPSLLALGAVHQRLVRARRRSDVGVVVVADDVRDTHGAACLLGYGADLICPRLALETVAELADTSDDGDLVGPEAQDRFRTALEAGVLKIMSKMGIATLDAYRSAQIFDAIGLGADVIELAFTGTASVVGGLDLDQLEVLACATHDEAFATPEPELSSPGWIRVRKGGEPHGRDKDSTAALNALALVAETPPVSDPSRDPLVADMRAAHLLQRAIAEEREDLYETFASLVDDRPPLELADLLGVVTTGAVDAGDNEPLPVEPIPLEDVEPASDIVRRFSTGAMSHGALSREAHETLAQAMNLLGARSNCGEGGEAPDRYRTRGQGRNDRNSVIKQVASGRFGVTPEYLAFADEIQIKMAQGSKPGEGGQLPGHKVTHEIARLRYTQPGVGLISPPPHHDIYSIEDLAQLIYDLKQVNAAQVSVKLVAEDGVGTIAAGCVKALADVVHLSGANGGTGASPLSSIKHAGMPWEIGLVDAQHALVDNGLRSRVRLRVDGGFATGRQVLIAALLGADEFSFGTAAMIAEGCIMLRACHRDTCKPGVATQREHLRANFSGTPEGVAAYFLFVAADVRRRLAALGARSLDEVIGRVELLAPKRTGDAFMDSVDLGALLESPEPRETPRRFVERIDLQNPRAQLGDRVLVEGYRAIWEGDDATLDLAITNADRAVGTALSGALGLEYGATPPRGTVTVRLTGTAGQSLGAFLGPGVHLQLTGDANDYVGKGMAGGRIVVSLDDDARAALAVDSPPVLVGNTCLYGATGGSLFVGGAVGERFAVRNSGALAVIEAAGDHCAEYMTGGTVVVLGHFGVNLGAGMTGGEVFVWEDETDRLLAHLNADLVEAVRPEHQAEDRVRWLVTQHAELTRSPRSASIIRDWDTVVQHLWHLVPRDRVERIASSTARRVAVA